MSIPNHVAIIMDGNGRWAKQRRLPRYFGHREGVNSLKRIVRYCGDIGIKILTVYAFSTENWNRPAGEVQYLMKLMELTFGVELEELVQNGVKVRVIGDITSVSPKQQQIWRSAEERTKHNDRLYLNVAFNYGGRMEITQAVRGIASDILEGKFTIDQITEEVVNRYLYTKDLADPDLIIRTGGELRMSNFLLWQSAYSEWYFTETLWPDFDIEEFKKALESFKLRERRFGRVYE